jgi:hypothetical protein
LLGAQGSRAVSTVRLGKTDMAHDLMAILGAVLIIFGVTLLVLVDAPRWMYSRIAAIGAGRRSNPALPGSSPGGAPQQWASAHFQGLAPGWYRDTSNPQLARYWNGVALSDERRSVAAPEPQAPAAAPHPYQGLAPGWYRDESTPSLARYWNGTALGDERRPVTT